MISLIVALVSIVLQGFLLWWDASKDPPRSPNTKKMMGYVAILLTFLLVLMKLSDVRDLRDLQDKLKSANEIATDNHSLSMKMDRLMSYSILDHSISDEDERAFLSVMRNMVSLDWRLSATRWTDGSYHFYWYEGDRMVATGYCNKDAVSDVMPKILYGEEYAVLQWFDTSVFTREASSVGIWLPGLYPAGSYAGEIGYWLVQFLNHIGVPIKGFVVDNEQKTIRFVLNNPSPRLLLQKGVEMGTAGPALVMNEFTIVSLIGKSTISVSSAALNWVRDVIGDEFIVEPRRCVDRRWESLGAVMYFIAE